MNNKKTGMQLLFCVTFWATLVLGAAVTRPRDDTWNLAPDEKLIVIFDLGLGERLTYLGKIGAGNFAEVTAVQSLPGSSGVTARACGQICVRKSNRAVSELNEKFSQQVTLKEIPEPDAQMVNENKILRYINAQMVINKNEWRPKVPYLIKEDGPFNLETGTPIHVSYISYMNGQTLSSLQRRLARTTNQRDQERDTARLLVRVARELVGLVDWMNKLPMPIANSDVHLENIVLDWRRDAAFPDAYSIDFGVAQQTTSIDAARVLLTLVHIFENLRLLYEEAGLRWKQDKLEWVWPRWWPEPSANRALRKMAKLTNRGSIGTIMNLDDVLELIRKLLALTRGAQTDEPSASASLSYDHMYLPHIRPEMLAKVNGFSPRLFGSKQEMMEQDIPGPWVPMKVKVVNGSPDTTQATMLSEEMWCHHATCYPGKCQPQ